MPFDGSPIYLIAPEIRAKRFEEGKTVAIKGPDGARDEIYVPGGHWAIRDADGAYELGDADFTTRFIAVPPDPASFAMRGRPARATRSAGGFAVEGRDDAMSETDFLVSAVRLDENGKPLCRVSAPLAVQAEVLSKARGDAARAHLDDLRLRARALRAGIISDAAVAADLNLMDVILSGRRDVVSDGMAGIHLARPPEGLRSVGEQDGQHLFTLDPESVRGRIVTGVGVPPQAVVDLIHSPAYGSSAFRALMRSCLTPYLEGCTMEDVLAVPIPPGDTGHQIRAAVRSWLASADLVGENPGIEIAEMPDYRTSPVKHYRFADERVDALSFDDVFGSYLYAWRTPAPPTPAP